MRDDKRSVSGKGTGKTYEPPRLHQYGSLLDIVRMKGVAGETDPLGGQPTKSTSQS